MNEMIIADHPNTPTLKPLSKAFDSSFATAIFIVLQHHPTDTTIQHPSLCLLGVAAQSTPLSPAQLDVIIQIIQQWRFNLDIVEGGIVLLTTALLAHGGAIETQRILMLPIKDNPSSSSIAPQSDNPAPQGKVVLITGKSPVITLVNSPY